MTQEEQIRLYRLMEKLNWFFHQEMHYLDKEIAEQTARECYPEIREFTYDILWNDLPKEVQEQLMDEELGGDDYFGFGVDAGMGCIADIQTQAAFQAYWAGRLEPAS